MKSKNFAARAICALAASFFIFAASAQLQRVPNTSLAMPSSPPTYGYTSTNAFPGLIFTNPICIVAPPGETNRIFILSKNGVIAVITNLAAPKWTTFMDLTPQVSSQTANSGTAGERGLLGMAFHPGFATNGFFYILYMSDTGSGTYYDNLSRFKISAGNANQGDTNTQVFIYKQVDRDPNHNSGDIHFGVDGYIYVTVGDEGAEHDGRNCAQIITNGLFSGMLRLDVDKRPGNLQPNPAPSSLTTSTNYLIPADNPFIGTSSFDGISINPNMVRTEFYAVGMRNPWRWNFDFYTNAFGTNVLYCGDVGQDNYEEVDVVEKGGNYGWAYWEGTNIASGSDLPHDTYVPTSGTNIRFPIVNYAHSGDGGPGNCVIGGVVYRGSNLPQLYGNYIYGDYSSGSVWKLVATNYVTGPTNVSGSVGPGTPMFTDSSLDITAFGTDPRNGDVLFCATKTTGYATAATINKIIYNTVTNGAPLPPTLYDTGAFTNLMSLTSPQDALQTATGILPYTINVPFWSDNAIKSRWFSVPNTNLTIVFNASGNWSFPTGTVWIKHFNLELTNGDLTSQIRLETRLLVKNSSGIYGATYIWNSKTNAVLAPTAGMDTNYVINDGGIIRTQTWHFPSQQECQTCHTSAGGFGLGFRTEQLNDNLDYGFGATNEIQALSGAGYFSSPVTNAPGSLLALAAATNASVSLEFRSRSFLAANCSQCHQPGGTAQQANWDARITTPTALAGLINAALVNNLGSTSNHVITPLSLTNSILLTRDATRDLGANPSLQMPPLDSNITDTEATNLLAQWILSMTNQFWIGGSPDPQTVTPGNNATYTITFINTPDFTSNVTLTVSGSPGNSQSQFSPSIVNSTTTNSTLTIQTYASTPVGSYIITVTGTGGGATSTDTMSLVVVSNNASPGTLLWTSGSDADTNWSDALNWTNVTAGGYGPPGPANNLQFTNTAAVSSSGTANNFVDGSFVIGSLQYANNTANTSPNYHVTLVNDGQTLIVTNGVVVGTAADSGASQVANAVITGGNGILILSNGIFAVTQGSGTDGAHQAVLDLSGLGVLKIASVSRIALGVDGVPPQNGNGVQRCSGVLYLAKTNFISVTSTGVTNGILIGWNDSQGNGNNFGVPTTSDKGSALYLGQTNAVFTDAIYVGTDKSLGCLLAFNPSGLNNPVAYFRGIGGANSRVSLWGIGDTSMKANSNQSASGTNDFTGGTIDALVASMNIGVSETGASTGNTGNGTGVLTFSAGTIDVNNLTNGWSVGTGTNLTDNGTGTINVGNGGTLKVNNVLALAQNIGGGAGLPSGTLNVKNGTLIVNTVVAGGASAITLSGATLTVTNKIGAPASAIGAFAATNSSLHLNLNGAAISTNIVVTNLIAGGVNTIVIDSVKNVGNATNFPLIAYSTFTGTVAANFAKGSLPTGFSANLVNNPAQKRIDLVVAASTNVTPHIGALNLSGNNFIFSGSNGFPGGFYYVLTSSNVALPLNLWTPIATNPFDVNGAFDFTNPMSTNTQLFYLLQLQ